MELNPNQLLSSQNTFAYEGEVNSALLPRLQDVLSEPFPLLNWSLTGERHPTHGLSLLQLLVQGWLTLDCCRCGAPLDYHFNTHSRLLLAPNEEEADRLESLGIEQAENLEVVVLPPILRIEDMVEDEILLELLTGAEHDTCNWKMPVQEELNAMTLAWQKANKP